MTSPVQPGFRNLSSAAKRALLIIVFAPFASAPALGQSIVEWKTNYYAVSGGTVHDIRRSINQSRPWRETSNMDASTLWRIKWDANVASVDGDCRCRSFTTKATITLTLPRWIGPTNAQVTVSQEWKRYIAALEAHEFGHARFALSAVRDMHKRIFEIGTRPDCATLTRTINQLARGIVEDYRKREKEYDARTMHGIRDGATLR
jgi:predicted secreted Zn-dependent protease